MIFSLLLSVAVHYLVGAIRLQTPGPKMTIAARRHVTILVFLFIVLKAIAYWFDRYGLVYSNRGKVTGASYTDVNASLPAKTILFWIAVIIALGVLASLWLKSPLLPVTGFVVLLILSIAINGIYPAIVQQVTVKPNASQKEAKYISRNITATRAGVRHRHRPERHVRHVQRQHLAQHDGDRRQQRGGRHQQPDGRRSAHSRSQPHLADLHSAAAHQERLRLPEQARRRPVHRRRADEGLHRRRS